MRTRESFQTLIVELAGDVRELTRIVQQNDQAWRRIQGGARDAIDWGALGFTLHTLYGIFENYFLRVSKFFENDLPRDRWHRALLEKMSLEVPGVRPALLTDPALKAGLQELLRFRHRFRNLYGEDLDPVKTAEVQKGVPGTVAAFCAHHEAFISKLGAIGEAMR